MNAKRALIPADVSLSCSFDVNKVAKAALIAAMNDAQHGALSVSYNLFWTTKVIATLRAHHLAVLETGSNFLTLQLTKRVPIWLMRQAFSQVGLPVRGTGDRKVFNGMKVSLGTVALNKRLIEALPSVMAQGATVRTECAGLFQASHTEW